jgi:hypothetical protein
MQKAADLSRSSGPTARSRPVRDLLAPRGFGERHGTEDSGFVRPLAGPGPLLGALSRAPIGVRAKLAIGAVDGPLEREADCEADQVIRMPDPALYFSAAPPQVSRKCAACEEEEKKNLQMKSDGGGDLAGAEAAPIVHEALREPGQPLDPATRAFFEPRFGYDFGGVRVHSDRKSSESARKMNALSYTVRQNIVFADGRYDPRALEGRRLIAHELAHTIQQDNQPRPLALHSEPIVQRQDDGTPDPSPKDSSELGATATPPSPASGLDQLPKGDAPNCIAAPGPPPALSNCAEYAKNSWWLPLAYVVNASCACLSTPNSPTANCVRKFLQDRLAATPSSLKSAAVAARAAQAAIPYSPPGLGPYDVFVQTVLTLNRPGFAGGRFV